MQNNNTYFFSPTHYVAWKEKDIAHVNEQLRAEIERLHAENAQLKKQLAELRKANTAPVVREYHILKEDVNLSGDVDKNAIVKIVFEASLKGKPNDAWDVSEAQDKSIMAWVDEQNILHVGSDGIICANPDSSELFRDYSKAIAIDFGENFDTSKVTNMRSMFSGCKGLTKLNVSSFDTSKVADMNRMFSHCESLIKLDLSSFNTRKVTDMRYMFFGCKNLRELDISSFDTSNVTRMGSVFEGCTAPFSMPKPKTKY